MNFLKKKKEKKGQFKILWKLSEICVFCQNSEIFLFIGLSPGQLRFLRSDSFKNKTRKKPDTQNSAYFFTGSYN